MSRIAKNPIPLPAGVEVKIEPNMIQVKGPKVTLSQPTTDAVKVEIKDNQIHCDTTNDSHFAHAMSGTMRALINNMVIGVTKGFEKKLLLVGVGYRAQVQGNTLNLTLGYSHPIAFKVPEGITIETPSQTEIVIKGANKQQVGQVAANVRAFRKPEPYKGKGVRYADEVIVLKETKKK